MSLLPFVKSIESAVWHGRVPRREDLVASIGFVAAGICSDGSQGIYTRDNLVIL